MLFDLRGRGRRRTIQVIYAGLAVLMGGGLIFFGIGGATSGGLFDALGGGNGNGGDANKIVQQRLDTLQKRVEANPNNTQAWADLARARFSNATSIGYDQQTGAYTDKGREQLAQSGAAWQRYLALKPAKVDVNLATQMVAAYGQGALQQYDKAVQAMEIVLDNKKPTAAAYAQLSVLAHGAKQERKSQLAEQKATELTPKAQRKTLTNDLAAAKSQIDQAAAGTATTG